MEGARTGGVHDALEQLPEIEPVKETVCCKPLYRVQVCALPANRPVAQLAAMSNDIPQRRRQSPPVGADRLGQCSPGQPPPVCHGLSHGGDGFEKPSCRPSAATSPGVSRLATESVNSRAWEGKRRKRKVPTGEGLLRSMPAGSLRLSVCFFSRHRQRLWSRAGNVRPGPGPAGSNGNAPLIMMLALPVTHPLLEEESKFDIVVVSVLEADIPALQHGGGALGRQ